MTHRLVRRPLSVSELYDLAADPLELRNVYGQPEHATTQGELEQRMLDWFVRTSDVVPLDEHPRGLPQIAG